MKKRVLPILIVIFALLVLAAVCIILFSSQKAVPDLSPAPSELEPATESSVIITGSPDPVSEPTETPARPLQSLIFINGRLYSLSDIDIPFPFDQKEHKLFGVLEKSVSRYEEPTEELTTNDEALVGCEVRDHIGEEYPEQLAIRVDKLDWIYTPYEPVPEEEKTYSFESSEELVTLAVSSMEKMGYTQIDGEKYELFQFAAIPEECSNFIGVFEHVMEAPDRYRVVQLWYGTDPYRLLVLSQEHMDTPTPERNHLAYFDRTRSQLSPDYAWVTSQARFEGASESFYLIAELYSSEDISGGYGDFIIDIVGKDIADYPDYVKETLDSPPYRYVG